MSDGSGIVMPEDEVLRLVVAGKPQPQGSLAAFVLWKSRSDPETGEPTPDRWKWEPLRREDGSIAVNVTSDNDDLKAWRAHVHDLARAAMGKIGVGNLGDPDVGFIVQLVGWLKRPENHWSASGALKEWAPARPLTHPDVDKLLRATFDALTGVVWHDDAQVVCATTAKRYAVPTESSDQIRAEIIVWRAREQRATDLPDVERMRWVPPTPAAPGQESLL